MTNRTIFAAALTCMLLAASAAKAQLLFESEVRYEQVVSTDTGTQTLTDGVTAFPGDVTRTFNTANAEYRFETVAVPDSPFELKSKARLEVDIDGRGTELGWNSVSATARAVSGLTDTAFVDGVPGQVGGFIEFLWLVSGLSEITLDPQITSDGYAVNQLETVAILNPSEGDGLFVEVLRDDQVTPLGGTTVSSIQPGLFSEQVFAVDWFAGQEFDVFFELATFSRLEITNLDAAGFEADVNADFSNTGILDQIRIYDNDGNLLPDATIISTGPLNADYSDLIVPEPSSGVSLLWILGMVGCYARRQQRRR